MTAKDKKIDDLVYKLYGLTEEEIRNVVDELQQDETLCQGCAILVQNKFNCCLGEAGEVSSQDSYV